MRLIILFIITILWPLNAQAKINVFACEPEWQALAEEIGGEEITNFSATSAMQDPHHIRAKPSLIAKIRNADLLICSGGELESGWLPILLTKAKESIQHGKIGYLMAADFVDTIEKPEILDRSDGHIHADGNPHIHLDPYNILIIASEINQRMQKIDPNNAENYQKNYQSFKSEWKAAIARWENKALPLRNQKIIVYHKSFSYLINWLRMIETASLEPKPGVSPTASHLATILKIIRDEPKQFIITTPYDPKDSSEWLNEKTGIKIVTLPFTIGGDKQSYDLFSLFENSINLMLDAK